jgi:hypothetical protein
MTLRSLVAALRQTMVGKTYDTFAEWLADNPEPSL